MDIVSMEFLTALLAIVMIDIVLAGDNAIVIALAARSLPRHLQRPAIVWGTVGAIAVRSAMTLVVVWLLKIPGLMLVGGAALVWIACRLLQPENSDDEGGHIKPVAGFWAAMQTIVVADMIMGLDNVLAVAGAAQGSYVLVILGLLISVPLVVWGSTLLLHWVERFPVIVYVGAGVLAWTAAKMITSETFLQDVFNANPAASALLYIALIGGVLWTGFVMNHRKLASRIATQLAELARQFEDRRKHFTATEGEALMHKILVPVDGSRNTEYALERVAREYLSNPSMEIHLLNVQPPLSRHISRFVARKNRASHHRDEAEKVLGPVRKLMQKLGLPFKEHVLVGERAGSIVAEAERLGVDRVVMSTARKNSLTRMLEDSTTNKVLERTTVPVEVVAGDTVSRVERWGLRAGVGAVIVLLVAAAVD